MTDEAPETTKETNARLLIEAARSIPPGVWLAVVVLGGPAVGVTVAQYLGLATQDEIGELREEIAELREDLNADRTQREHMLEMVRDLAKTHAPE